jgi:predicted aspartyl protease
MPTSEYQMSAARESRNAAGILMALLDNDINRAREIQAMVIDDKLCSQSLISMAVILLKVLDQISSDNPHIRSGHQMLAQLQSQINADDFSVE